MIIHCYSNSQRVKLGGLNGDKKKNIRKWGCEMIEYKLIIPQD
jgi:hypothetical protein